MDPERAEQAACPSGGRQGIMADAFCAHRSSGGPITLAAILADTIHGFKGNGGKYP